MNKGEIIVVSGLPRSGTSLMMQMLCAGGVPVVSDALRSPDEDNPRGYFELEVVKRLRAGSSMFLADLAGKAVKIVTMLLRDLPRTYAYRVILMERPLREVLASQRAMLQRRGVAVEDPDVDVLAAMRHELSNVDGWLLRNEVTALRVDHGEVLAAPRRVSDRLNAFLGGHLDAAAMAAAVDPALYRQRCEAHCMAGSR